MKSLISINRKFMDLNIRDLVDSVLRSKYIKGFELFLNAESGFEIEYLYNLLYEVKRNNLILQVHSDINVDYETQLDFLKQLEQCSNYLGEQLVVVFHSIYDEDINESLRKTAEYLGNLINNVDNSKLAICLENLNSTKDKIRLGKNEIREILSRDKNSFNFSCRGVHPGLIFLPWVSISLYELPVVETWIDTKPSLSSNFKNDLYNKQYSANSCDSFVFPVPELPVKIAKGFTFKDKR